jgi:DNA-binding transcriptional MerR regulator
MFGSIPKAYLNRGQTPVFVARFAQSVGFTLSEIKALFNGFKGRSGLGKQWRPLAEAKLKEIDAAIAKAQQMKAAIESGLRCGCIRVEDCLPAAS